MSGCRIWAEMPGEWICPIRPGPLLPVNRLLFTRARYWLGAGLSEEKNVFDSGIFRQSVANFNKKNFLCTTKDTGVAQLVEHWSPKPGVGSSSLSTRAEYILNSGNLKLQSTI